VRYWLIQREPVFEAKIYLVKDNVSLAGPTWRLPSDKAASRNRASRLIILILATRHDGTNPLVTFYFAGGIIRIFLANNSARSYSTSLGKIAARATAVSALRLVVCLADTLHLDVNA